MNKFKEALAEKMEIPRDVVMNVPKITVTGDSDMLIENHKGIEAFHEKMIQVNSKLGVISIEGEGLEIVYIGGATLAVRGSINKIYYGEKKDVAEEFK
ncbi:sporulation protein YqfC [Alloiococcus sp. CFN-8]|uniref:sporulation protein YqfC n=1 Tax=Alloiococcus sp. CFN-8 TaxID=3416081 RepID=UPI003CF36011